MNQAIVVDASVAIKWVLQEELSEQAEALLVSSAREPIVGPPHLAGEVTNALYQRTRRTENNISDAEAEQALAQYLRIGVELVGPPALYQQAFSFGRSHGLRSIYDSLYVVLAQMLGAELWTADRTLLNVIGGAAPWVRWIGDYSPRK